MTTAEPVAGPQHGRRIFLLWLVLSLVATPVVVLVWGPHLPPQGSLSEQAHTQHEANIVLSGIVTPIFLFVVVFFLYAIVVFRQRGDEIEDGPPLRGHGPIQVTWVSVTAIVVLTVAVFGAVELLGKDAGAGGGQGPQPLVHLTGKSMPVQVIAQQWGFTYRYPTFGGVETYTLDLPEKTNIELHVTSLDVVHSFWAYQLGVKADAVPGEDNVAYVIARRPGSFQIRCSELCGLWHAQMTGRGHVLSKGAFASWIAQMRTQEAPELKYLPPYSTTYLPDPARRAG